MAENSSLLAPADGLTSRERERQKRLKELSSSLEFTEIIPPPENRDASFFDNWAKRNKVDIKFAQNFFKAYDKKIASGLDKKTALAQTREEFFKPKTTPPAVKPVESLKEKLVKSDIPSASNESNVANDDTSTKKVVQNNDPLPQNPFTEKDQVSTPAKKNHSKSIQESIGQNAEETSIINVKDTNVPKFAQLEYTDQEIRERQWKFTYYYHRVIQVLLSNLLDVRGRGSHIRLISPIPMRPIEDNSGIMPAMAGPITVLMLPAVSDIIAIRMGLENQSPIFQWTQLTTNKNGNTLQEALRKHGIIDNIEEERLRHFRSNNRGEAIARAAPCTLNQVKSRLSMRNPEQLWEGELVKPIEAIRIAIMSGRIPKKDLYVNTEKIISTSSANNYPISLERVSLQFKIMRDFSENLDNINFKTHFTRGTELTKQAIMQVAYETIGPILDIRANVDKWMNTDDNLNFGFYKKRVYAPKNSTKEANTSSEAQLPSD